MTSRPADALAEAHLAPLVSRGEVPSLAWAVVRDEDTAAGGFGGAEPRTIFQIGSVTKVFTALLLADMAARPGYRLDWRTTSRQGTVRVPCAGFSEIAASSSPAATRPTSSRHMSTLLSEGWAPSAIGSQLS
jgi:hypothetical protein